MTTLPQKKQNSSVINGRLAGLLAVLAVYAFLYIPIIIFLAFSFNDAKFPAPWAGFTLRWYKELFYDYHLWQSLYHSLLVSFSAVFLSVSMSLLCIFYVVQQSTLHRTMAQFYANLVVPEIVLAVGFLGLFTYCSIPLGAMTLIIAQTVLGLGYVIPIIYARYQELDPGLTEAAMDLGASPWQIFFTVTLPLLQSSIYGAAILVFIISFEDFVLAYFCSGTSFQTLPLYIFAMLRTGVSPVVNALSCLLLVMSCLLIMIYSSFKTKAKIF